VFPFAVIVPFFFTIYSMETYLLLFFDMAPSLLSIVASPSWNRFGSHSTFKKLARIPFFCQIGFRSFISNAA